MQTVLWLSLIEASLLVVFSHGLQIQFPTIGGSGGGGGFNFPNKRPDAQSQSQSVRPASTTLQSSYSKGCNCLPKSECPKGLGQLQYACLPKGGGEGICCIPQEGIVLNPVGFPSNVPLTNIPQNIVDIGIEKGKKTFQTLLEKEQERLKNGQFLKIGDPARAHAFFFSRTNSSKEQHDLALTIALASKEIAKMLNLNPQDSFSSLPQIKYGSSVGSGPQCLLSTVPRCESYSKYRTIDGSCNNLKKPLLGKSETGFSRIRPQLYDDGLMKPRGNGVDGLPLPDVQKVSSNILFNIDLTDRTMALSFLQWAQFIDHDLSRTPIHDMDGKAIMCCEKGSAVSPLPESCFPILTSPKDGSYGPERQGCVNFVRSTFALNEDCAFGPVEQLNAVTHFLDGSMIYGSTEATKHNVADLSTGFMRTSANDLPPVSRTIDCEAQVGEPACFVGGDSRISEQPGLTAMHTLWVREHNRIAAILKRLNPHWKPNQLYEETRRIVIAQIQHITYNEFLPIVIGPSLMSKLGINVLTNGYRNSYDPSLDPRVANEFSTAAFRFSDSLAQKFFRKINETFGHREPIIRSTLYSPDLLQNYPENLNQLFLFLIFPFDRHTPDSESKYENPTARGVIMNLINQILQRGRDHAISTYNVMSETFGLGKAETFLDLLNTTPRELIKSLEEVYRRVDDIDLWIGGMIEKPVAEGILGPTFANIVGRQFQVSMNGDRYFYDMGNQSGSFTPDQLQEIRKASIARIFCDNAGLRNLQHSAFKTLSESNPREYCSGNVIDQVNLEVFKEY